MPDKSTEALVEWQEVSTKVVDWLKDEKELRGMLNLSDDALGKLSKVNAWVGGAISLLQLAGVFPEGPDPIKQLYDQLNRRLEQILAEVRRSNLWEHITDIEELVTKAVSSAKGAREFINRGRPGDADLVLGDEDASSREAVEGLIDYNSKKWTHIPWPELSGEIPMPRDEVGLVWDYRWALPAVLKAIAARLAVCDAIEPDHRKTGRYSTDIGEYANQLLAIHRKLTEAISPMRFVTVTQSEVRRRRSISSTFPEDFDIRYGEYSDSHLEHGSEIWIYSIPLRKIDIHDLRSIAVRCGAVEYWSSESTILDWHPLGKPPDRDDEVKRPPYSEIDKDKYFSAFASQTRSRWLAVYDAIGLDSLASIVTSLMLLARVEPPKSLREMAAAFEARHFPPAPGGAHASLRSLLYWVGIGEKGSLGQVQKSALKEKLFSYVPEVMNQALTRDNLAIG
jgi:hypothetical protein